MAASYSDYYNSYINIKKISYREIGNVDDKYNIIISHDVDMDGAVCELPVGYTLVIREGKLKNGILVGNDTRLICKEKAFYSVKILGTWNIKKISTDFFCNLNYDNALKDVMALANSEIDNIITIGKGDYWVAAQKNNDCCLEVKSNTTVIIDGTIKLRPNNFSKYQIIFAQGHDITIKGNGFIVGDKHSHLGDKGEWGMGVNLHGVKRAMIKGLSIRDCWGDCVYIGGKSKNVVIKGCHLDHGRRQGISITSADSVIIRDCTISNIKGTSPQYAIDIETNKGDTVNNVLIENVKVWDCHGGFLATEGKEWMEQMVGNVVIRDCQLSVDKKMPIRMKKCSSVVVDRCFIITNNPVSAIFSQGCGAISVKENIIINNNKFRLLKNSKKKILDEETFNAITIVDALMHNVTNNKILEW